MEERKKSAFEIKIALQLKGSIMDKSTFLSDRWEMQTWIWTLQLSVVEFGTPHYMKSEPQLLRHPSKVGEIPPSDDVLRIRKIGTKE